MLISHICSSTDTEKHLNISYEVWPEEIPFPAGQALGTPIALAAAPHRIPVNLTVAANLSLAMAVEDNFHQSLVEFFETCSP